jgi:hypothetical protein
MEGENGLEAVKSMVKRQCLAAGGGEAICGRIIRIVEDAVERSYIEKTASNGRTRIAVRWVGSYDYAALTVAAREGDGRKVAVLGLGGGGLPPLVITILDDGTIEEIHPFTKDYFSALDPHPNAVLKLFRGQPPV